LDVSRNERTHRWPEAFPDGRAVLFTDDDSKSTEYYDDARIEAYVPATRERQVVLEGASMGWYEGGNRLTFARGGAPFAIGFDPRTLKTQGTPVQVLQGVATDVSTGAVSFAPSESGAAVWAPGSQSVGTRYVWVDRKGAETGVPIPPVPYNELALAGDGKRAAFIGGPRGAHHHSVPDPEPGRINPPADPAPAHPPDFAPPGPP